MTVRIGEEEGKVSWMAALSDGTLVNIVAPLAINNAMMVFYLMVIIRYSVIMTLVGILSLTLNIVAARYLFTRLINLSRMQMRDAGKLASRHVDWYKHGRYHQVIRGRVGVLPKWSGYQPSVNTQKVKYTTLNARVGLIQRCRLRSCMEACFAFKPSIYFCRAQSLSKP